MPLLKATYINHLGQQVKFGDVDGLFLNQHDLFNFSWNVQTRGNRIVNLNRLGVRENNIPLVIVAETREKAAKLANDFFKICEFDLIANKKGKLIVNGYSLNCFIRGQDYSDWSDISKCLKISAKVIRDGVWYKRLEPITFGDNDGENPLTTIAVNDNAASPSASLNASWTGGDKGYYYGYPYNYLSTTEEHVFLNDKDVPLSWKAIIYGPTTTGTIRFTIGEHDYYVSDTMLNTGERLEITAKESLDEKTVFKIDGDGNRENCFSKRGTDSYLFEPIPPGEHVVSFDADMKWTLIPILERSSPEWL